MDPSAEVVVEEENVPTYTETDPGSFATWADSLEDAEGLGLPLTRFPEYVPRQYRTPLDDDIPHQRWLTQSGIINSFLNATRTKNVEVINMMVSQGLVSPDIIVSNGVTPLISAVEAGNATMVSALISLGAQVDAIARWNGAPRTALMVAAATGNLAIVKLLRDKYGADDGIIAPDGQLALRLAADNGHREIVKYLPARRGGEWRRWKTHHDVAMRRARRALEKMRDFLKFLLWEVPRFFVWSVPKHAIVLPIRDASRWAWKNRQRFGGWCKRQVVELPGRVAKAGKAAWERLKKVPRAVWDVAKKTPRAVWETLKVLAKFIWKAIKAVPKVLEIVFTWIWESLKKAGSAVAHAVGRLFSLLHTAVEAIVSFFRRITLKDVWDGVCAVFRAVFITVPKAIWAGIQSFGEVSYKAMKAMFGFFGEAVWWIVTALGWLVIYLPRQVWKVVQSVLSSAGNGVHEVRVWINPKI